jgi:hypothetical protein
LHLKIRKWEAEMSNEERLIKITNMIERHRYNLGVSSCEIAELVAEVDEDYLAAQAATEEARTDGFHGNL